MRNKKRIAGICLLMAGMGAPSCLPAQGKVALATRQVLSFSAVKGTDSQPDTIVFSGKLPAGKAGIHITGEKRSSFKWIYLDASPTAHGVGTKLAILFTPASDFIGVATARLQATGVSGKTIREFDLRGLSLNGLEGANEPTLLSVFDVLGYRIDPGWSGLTGNLKPNLQGDEVHAFSFKKAGWGQVDLQPVARFSPDYELPFGYYTHSSEGPGPHQLGTLARTKTSPQHQTLFPRMLSGTHSFDPGDKEFGLYTTSPTHTSYTADDWNLLLSPGKAAHAARVYPAKDPDGRPLPDTYLICFEEAQNADYQDYVFVIKNVRPIPEQEEFAPLMNGKDLDGWNVYLQNKGLDNDPENNFSVEDGIVHVRGKYLGYIRTKGSFTGYHFKVEFKWGEKKWPPRENAKRDAGICYNIPVNEPDSIWPKSIECQIQEGDVGDFWLLSFSTIEVSGERNQPSNHTRVIKRNDGEKPNGEWNTVEVISYHGRCIQIVNGIVVNDGDHASVENGRILLQSEYSEVYYRNARINEW